MPYDLNNFDDVETKNIMNKINKEGKYIIPKDNLDKISKDFLSDSMSEQEVMNIIKEVHVKHGIVLDPHSAIAFGAMKKFDLEGSNVVLATAHPCKFPDAINQSINIKPKLPEELMYIMDENENYDIIPNSLDKTKKYIKEKIQ